MLSERVKILSAAGLRANDVLVVVEGRDDRTILEKMMPPLPRLRIRAVAELLAGSTGSTSVIRIVNDVMKNEDFVVGIVDRDVVRDDESHFFEVDDVIFSRQAPFGPKVRIWTRGEIESYLIDPKAMSWLCSSCLHAGASVSPAATLAVINDVVSAVTRFSAFNMAVRTRNRTHQDAGDELAERWSIDQTLTLPSMDACLRAERRWSMVQHDVSRYDSKIRSMGSAAVAGTEAYVLAMLRALDGKALFWRVVKLLKQPDKDAT
ncbi:MAG: hypothetical protein R3B09_26900, partial [Nannocystaceae bacterium]